MGLLRGGLGLRPNAFGLPIAGQMRGSLLASVFRLADSFVQHIFRMSVENSLDAAALFIRREGQPRTPTSLAEGWAGRFPAIV